MRRAAPLLALLALAVVLAPPVAAATVHPVDRQSGAPALTRPGSPPDRTRLSAPANTTIVIDVYPNRSARWRVTMTYALDSPNETATFRRYADAYRNGETDAGPSIGLFRRIVNASASATGRHMTVRDVARSERVGESTGSISLSFRWTNMLERTGNRTIALDDAVLLPANRTWIDTLEANQTLVVRTPDGYSVVDSDVPSFELRNNSVVVSGPARIDGHLQITYRRTSPAGEPDRGTPWGVVAGIVLVAVVGAGIYVYRRGRRGSASGASTHDDGGGDGGTGASAASDPSAAATDGAAPSASTEESAAETDPALDVELLSDEERVERLLQANDGRMKQATIVRETGWSDAKVSQLLSTMADEGRVNKLRLGRENLISLPDGDEAGD
ncbi:MAG: helix-turn-helix transcriptional regulator [Haloferacaceae archaeon]